MSALLSTGLHYNWLSLHIYSSKVQATSKSVSNDETDSLSTTSSKCVDGVTKSALSSWQLQMVKKNSKNFLLSL